MFAVVTELLVLSAVELCRALHKCRMNRRLKPLIIRSKLGEIIRGFSNAVCRTTSPSPDGEAAPTETLARTWKQATRSVCLRHAARM